MAPSKSKQSTTTQAAITKAKLVYERLHQQVVNRMTWMDDPSMSSRQNNPKVEPPRPPHPCYQSWESLHNLAPDQRGVQTQRPPSVTRKSLSCRHRRYHLTRNPFTKVTTKTKKASPDTAIVMRSVSVRWSLATMMPVHANGSICLVWG